MYSLPGRVAIVTGASGGIGAATAQNLARRGVHLVLAARRVERLQALAAELAHQHGVRAIAVRTDMSRRIDIDLMVQQTMDAFGRVDILINNAGLGLQGDLVDLPEHQLRYLFDVNVFGPVLAMQAVAPIMQRQGGGVIVNVGSILGKIPVPSLGMVGSSAAYTASKFALDALSAVARMELAADRVRVITVIPGVTATDFDANFLITDKEAVPSRKKRAGLLGLVPAERVAERIVTAIEQEEREVYVTSKDQIIVAGARLFPGPWEWVLRRVRAWRSARSGQKVRAAALAASSIVTVAVVTGMSFALTKRLRQQDQSGGKNAAIPDEE